MYSTQTSGYQANLRAAWEGVFLEYGVDVYLTGHIHWYERLLPLGAKSVVDNNTFYANPGNRITHIINGAAGNIESYTMLDEGQGWANFTVALDDEHSGFGRLTMHSAEELTWSYIRGDDGSVADSLTLTKRA